MVASHAGIILQHVRTVLEAHGADRLSDRELLRRFAQERDQAAFANLVCRHGPMVLQVCRRILHDGPDAEDVFQSTFLTLARKASARNWQESVGPWLHLVAYRLALKTRAAAGRRARLEPRADRSGSTDPQALAGQRETCTLLHEQMSRLPEHYRAPLVLCCLENCTRDEAARQLGWSTGTLKRRLERGRQLLRERLLRRGVAPAVLAAPTLPASLPAELFHKTIRLVEGLAPPAARRFAWIVGVFLVGLTAGGMFLALPAAPPSPPEAKAAPVDPPARMLRDQFGDPLPREALARLGTTRLRGKRCFFLPDGRRLLREVGGNLQVSEVPGGKPLFVFRASDVPKRDHIVGSTIAFSSDGKYLAGVCWKGRCGIWETATGKLVRWFESGQFYSIVRCDFSPDGKFLAVGAGMADGSTSGITVGVYEIRSGRQLFTVPGTNSQFAPDSRSLLAWQGYGHTRVTVRRVAVPGGKELSSFVCNGRFLSFARPFDGTLYFETLPSFSIRVWDVVEGKVKHTLRGPGGGQNDRVSVLHAPGRRELLAVGGRPGGVWCWERGTGKSLWKAELTAPVSASLLSADGTTLVTSDATGIVRVWDAATGKQRQSFIPAAIGHGSPVAVSPDGKTVATTSGGIFTSAVALWDSSTGKVLSDLPGHPSAIAAAAFAPTGATVYTIGNDRTLRTWDASSGKELFRTPADPSWALAVSPDGTTLFAAGPGSGEVRVLEARTGTRKRHFTPFTKDLLGQALAAGGKRLITAGRDRDSDQDLVRVFDAATGGRLHQFAVPARMEQLAVRPDGQAMATTHVGRRVVLWDAGGKKQFECTGRSQRTAAWARGETPNCIGSVALSPDGRWLAYSDQDQGVAIVDARTGREAGRARPGVYFQTPAAREELRNVLAFSPDGKTVAWSGAESSAEVFVIEARTQQVRRRLSGDSSPVGQLVFSPDGSRLLSAGPDGSALIWDVLGRSMAPAKAPAPAAQAAGWWERLDDASAKKAYQAMREMAADPSAAVALLRKKLKPVQEVKAARLDALLAGLDADDFKSREQASRDLVALADVAEPRLRAALSKPLNLEVKRRAQDALARIEAGWLRRERAIEVLEMIGNAAARKLLAELAGGMQGAAQTLDAAGALARMKRR
jgi:RNA polymerase sigma factor (sigma-70 family)